MTKAHEPAAFRVWQRFLFQHADGGVLTGRIVDVKPFGAFVELAEGIHGLLPSGNYTAAPEVGAAVSVRIENVDLTNRRLSVALV